MHYLSLAAVSGGTLKRAAQSAIKRLGASPARFIVGAPRAHNKALACLLLATCSVTFAATPPNTTIPNSVTVNYVYGGDTLSATATTSIITEARTPATVDFLRYTPAGSATTGTVQAIGTTECSTSGSQAGPFTPVALPTPVGGDPLAVPGNYPLAPTQNYGGGDPLFVKITDYDQNINPNVAETIIVTITSDTGDKETLRVTETGPSTGVFVGYLPTTRTPNPANNCQISVSSKSRLSASYVDVYGGEPIVADAALVDPFGVVFDSSTGNPINGATVTIIDVATGQPAKVFCPDSLTPYPSSMVTGVPFNACGGVIDLPTGNYQFPLVAAGTYRLQVTPPSGYSFASAVSTDKLQALAGAPFTIIAGSRGENFFISAGPAVIIDVPLDPVAAQLQITKSASKSVVAVGEFVPYTLTIRNEGGRQPARAVRIDDKLPAGFRFRAGSARLNDKVVADPSMSADGRTLSFNVGDIASNATVTLKYVAEVTVEARPGKAENIASAVGGVASNTARASVVVQDDLMRTRAILMGRVIIGSCDETVANDKDGLVGARILLEDGTYILTDKEGRWHADNIRAGTHVVQLDLESLPQDYEVMACEKNARFAGRAYSQFVNLQPGSLWRADFHVQKKALVAAKVEQQLSATREGNRVAVSLIILGSGDVNSVAATMIAPGKLVAGSVQLNGKTAELEDMDGMLVLRVPARKGTWIDKLNFVMELGDSKTEKVASMLRFVPPEQQGINLPKAEVTLVESKTVSTSTSAPIPASTMKREISGEAPKIPGSDDRTRLVEQLAFDADWLAQAAPGVEWLHPQEKFSPALPAIKVAIKHAPEQNVVLKVNGETIDTLKFDGTIHNAARTVSLSTWRGIAIVEGDNRFEMIVRDKDGREVLKQERSIHYSYGPDKVMFVPELSRLVADGKTRPVIALRFLDKKGFPVRRGMNGEFQLAGGYTSANQLEAIERDPLAGKIGNVPRYEINQDGLALVELTPTTQSGEAIMNFTFGEQRAQELRVWLEAGQRDWVLVGFAEGTLGHKKLLDNVQSIKDTGADEQLFDGNRIALYAKGSIKGDYLLTLAYDSAKRQGDAGSNLKQAIDPTRFYTLYADNAQAAFDAASARKLYLKIERRQFYALFGDFDTGLSVTEFSRYSRTVNGLKSEYKGEHFSYNAFATKTAQAYLRDEILGDGTSGLYKLSRGNLVENSDKVRIEARDRFETQKIVSSKTLSRYLDYDIDSIKGTLFFKSPIPGRDANFNPVYVVVEYESADKRDEKWVAGGRASFKPTDKMEVGATVVSDGTQGASGKLGGLDARYDITEKTSLKAEFALSERSFDGQDKKGEAWKLEAKHRDETLSASAYIRQQDGSFGLGQQAGAETGTRKIGGDVQLKLSETTQLQGQASHQETTGGTGKRDVIEARAEHTMGDLKANYGARLLRETDSEGLKHEGKQVTGGVAYDLLDKKVQLRATTEVGIGSKDTSLDFPDRLTLGVDYKVTEQSRLFAEHEIARGERISSNMSRVGVRTQPWTGGEMAASLGNSESLDSGRIFANVGLVQRVQLNEAWQGDVAVDRSMTLRMSGAPFNFNAPPASGSIAGDYTAVSIGANYNDKVWGANSRVEWRGSDLDRKINLLIGLQRNLDAGRVVSGGLTYTDLNGVDTQTRRLAARMSYASRPWDSKWASLYRLDYIDEILTTAADSNHSRKLVSNLHSNYMYDRYTQLSIHYGAKYVFDRIDGAGYGGYTDVASLEGRHDISENWEVAAHLSRMNTLRKGTHQNGVGMSAGYQLVTNTWLTMGYNFLGIKDDDFGAAQNRAAGVFLSVRAKFDQDSLKLNAKNLVLPEENK
jgi:uncharacterized repeat protein (TIGR01451 family)